MGVEEKEIRVPWLSGGEWRTTNEGFSISMDVSSVLEGHGPGVYTLVLVGNMDGEQVRFLKYSIFIYSVD